ncbi:MAG TPA: dihydroorotate dehydrogenase electron transfer subunit [Bacteroidales bacterium]|nr:dihydroorotate dehydrogenase electron transfer subunit [Bacteroidales bacterium]
MTKYIHDFRIIQNRQVNPGCHVLELLCPVKLPEIQPGQFAQLLVEKSSATYLRRPISIYDADPEKNTLSLMIKVVGEGTASLVKLGEGDSLNLVYPLGNSFSVPEGKKVLLVGGGVGIAPMLLLAKRLKAEGKEITILIGGRSFQDILEAERYEAYGSVGITTDDGSLGFKGLVTEHPAFAAAGEYAMIYACGPDPMMKAVARIAHKMGAPCEVSLENLMACGIGACLCCVAETTTGNRTTCVDGPVFNSGDLVGWE